MPRTLCGLLGRALTVHVPDPADTWRTLYDDAADAPVPHEPFEENPAPAPVQPKVRAGFRLLPGGHGRL